MINNSKNNSTPPPDSIDIQIAKLTFIAATIVTIGDGLAAIAAGLALQNLEKSSTQNSQSGYDQLKHIKKMIN